MDNFKIEIMTIPNLPVWSKSSIPLFGKMVSGPNMNVFGTVTTSSGMIIDCPFRIEWIQCQNLVWWVKKLDLKLNLVKENNLKSIDVHKRVFEIPYRVKFHLSIGVHPLVKRFLTKF